MLVPALERFTELPQQSLSWLTVNAPAVGIHGPLFLFLPLPSVLEYDPCPVQ
jgi:hypothetical protein